MCCNHTITMQWFEASVITMQNAKAGRRRVEGLLELYKSSLGNLIRPYLKSKKQTVNQGFSSVLEVLD